MVAGVEGAEGEGRDQVHESLKSWPRADTQPKFACGMWDSLKCQPQRLTRTAVDSAPCQAQSYMFTHIFLKPCENSIIVPLLQIKMETSRIKSLVPGLFIYPKTHCGVLRLCPTRSTVGNGQPRSPPSRSGRSGGEKDTNQVSHDGTEPQRCACSSGKDSRGVAEPLS